MTIEGEQRLLRIYVGEADRHGGIPLHEAIVQRARELGLAGATVLRGIIGFGARSVIHRASILRLSEDLPIVIEIVDAREKVDALLSAIESWIEDGMATIEKVEVVFYRSRRAPERA